MATLSRHVDSMPLLTRGSVSSPSASQVTAAPAAPVWIAVRVKLVEVGVGVRLELLIPLKTIAF